MYICIYLVLGSATNSTISIQTINILRWVLVASLLIYAVPIFFYVVLFGNGHVFFEVLLGAFSFLFYTPTYLNILNIYSLCRIDDISWASQDNDVEVHHDWTEARGLAQLEEYERDALPGNIMI